MGAAVTRGRERRKARRWTPQELPWPLACRITPGRDALIVDLSALGLLIETDTPLGPGRHVSVHLMRPSRRVTLSAVVVRAWVSALSLRDGPSFRIALHFDRWFEPMGELDSHQGER